MPVAPHTHTLPICRATSAACEETPPREVRIPSAAIMPRRSSGDVSIRASTTFSPFSARITASSALNTTRPHAAPGPAAKPLPIFFHRELEVLHVLEVTLKDAAHFHQLLVRRGHFPRQIGNRMGCTHTCDHVFALRIDQILAVKDFFAGGWIARKCNPCCACLSH